jgi:hypothetical protein
MKSPPPQANSSTRRAVSSRIEPASVSFHRAYRDGVRFTEASSGVISQFSKKARIDVFARGSASNWSAVVATPSGVSSLAWSAAASRASSGAVPRIK